jgi:hypothetical protein
MANPTFNSLDLTVLFGITGGKSAAAQKLELTAALDSLKSGIADLSRNDTSSDMLPLVLIFALSRRGGGGGGAPAEIGLPQAPSASAAPIAARSTSTQYAQT